MCVSGWGSTAHYEAPVGGSAEGARVTLGGPKEHGDDGGLSLISLAAVMKGSRPQGLRRC